MLFKGLSTVIPNTTHVKNCNNVFIFVINKNQFLKEEVKVIQEQCSYSMREMLPLEVLLW